MSETLAPEDVGQLLAEAFPDIRCLRCGHNQFLVATDVFRPSAESALGLHGAMAAPQSRLGRQSPIVTLACERCGHLEHHVTGLLMRAKKPVIESSSDEPL